MLTIVQADALREKIETVRELDATLNRYYNGHTNYSHAQITQRRQAALENLFNLITSFIGEPNA